MMSKEIVAKRNAVLDIMQERGYLHCPYSDDEHDLGSLFEPSEHYYQNVVFGKKTVETIKPKLPTSEEKLLKALLTYDATEDLVTEESECLSLLDDHLEYMVEKCTVDAIKLLYPYYNTNKLRTVLISAWGTVPPKKITVIWGFIKN